MQREVKANTEAIDNTVKSLGGKPANLTEHSRLLLIAARYRTGAALLVERSLGLRNPAQLRPCLGAVQTAWVKAQFEDEDGKTWRELDLGALVQQEEFLNVGH